MYEGIRTPAPGAREFEHVLGVLFVHGIGQQTRGSTLVGFGEPFHRYLRARCDGVHASWGRRGLSPAGVSEWLDELARGQPESDDATPGFTSRGDRDAAAQPRYMAAVIDLINHPAVSANRRSGPVVFPQGGIDAADDDVAAIRAEFGAATLRAGTGEDGAPASATLQVTRINVDGEVLGSSWRLAESWWAPAFHEPSYRDLAMWALRVLPWLIGSHFGAALRTRVREPARVSWWGKPTAVVRLAAALVYFLLAPLLILVSQSLLLLLWLPAAVPISRLRAWAGNLQRSIAATLGDSFVLLQSPIQAAAIRSQILSDILWLKGKCEKVAVVAHSQGAALMYQVMRDREVPVDLLITYGSGLRKLDELEQVQRHRFLDRFAPMTLFGVLATPLGVVSVLGGEGGGAVATGLLWTGVGLLALLGSWIDWYRGQTPADQQVWARELKDSGLDWQDIYAADDPVPNGRHELVDGYPVSQPVHNLDSIARDHTSYWDNTDEFTLSVVRHVGLLDDNLASIVEVDELTSARVSALRRMRVFLLAALRRLTWGSVLVIVAARWSRWKEVLEWVFDRNDPAHALGSGNYAAIALLAAALACYLAAAAIWRWWDRDVARTVADRLEADNSVRQRVLVMIGLGLIPPILAAVAARLVDVEGDAVPWIVSIAMIAVVSLLVLVPVFQERRATPAASEEVSGE